MLNKPQKIRTKYRINHGKFTMIVYCRPFDCTGKCLYCFQFDGITKSTGLNQDTLLGNKCDWDPVCQLSTRMQWYDLKKGSGMKYDIAIKGDSFANKDPGYLEDFLKKIYDFYNGTPSSNLEEAKELQVNAPDRCVTIKVETRPDHITPETCELMLRLGVTTVEIGVQSLDDHVLEINNRGHDVECVRQATELLIHYGFEFGYHIMVGMVGSSRELDYEILRKKLWSNGFQPDVLKLYPCILYKEFSQGSELAKKLNNGEWNPLTNEEYMDMLKNCLPYIPRYVHINRFQRFEEEHQIVAGPSKVIDRASYNGICQCLWHRSPAQTGLNLDGDFRNYRLEFTPQGNRGYCVEAVVGKNDLLGYGRLTLEKNNAAIIRDLRVLGNMLPIGIRSQEFRGMQHIGIGKSMLHAMEKKAIDSGKPIIRIHPAPGARAYFKDRGFNMEKDHPSLGWMAKEVL